MPRALGQGPGAMPAVERQPPCALGVERHPHPPGRPRQALAGFGLTDRPLLDRAAPGQPRSALARPEAHAGQARAGTGVELLRGLPHPLQPRLGLDLAPPGGPPAAHACGQTGQPTAQQLHGHPRAGQDGAMRRHQGTGTGRTRHRPPWAAMGMARGAQVATAQPASVCPACMRADLPRRGDDTRASVGGRAGGRWSGRQRRGRGGIACTRHTVRTLGEAREGGGSPARLRWRCGRTGSAGA